MVSTLRTVTNSSSSRLAMLFVCLLAWGAVVATAAAQEGQPDPKKLLTESAATIEATANASVNMQITSRMVRGEDDNSAVHRFHYSKGDSGKFALATVNEVGEEIGEGIIVRGNGELTLTWIPSIKRHQLNESSEGIAPFVKSGLAEGIANGLGSLFFSFFTTDTIDELGSQITNAEYVGLQDFNGQSLHHARYTVANDLTFDAWFTTEPNPVVIRIQPDLSDLAKSSPAAQQFDNFQYTVTLDFVDWDLNAQFAPGKFNYNEPVGSELVLSIMQRPSESPHPLLGAVAPPIELMNLAGEPVNLADHLGKDVVVLDFWATWCPPCVAALPMIDRVTSSFADKGVVFYAVDQGEDAETINAFLEQRGISPPVLLDTEQAASSAYGVQGLPTSVIIGKDGKVQIVHVGLAQDLDQKLTKELSSLVAGEDLVGKYVQELQAKQAVEQAQLLKLQKKLQQQAVAN